MMSCRFSRPQSNDLIHVAPDVVEVSTRNVGVGIIREHVLRRMEVL